MVNIKTTITIQKSTLAQAEVLARKMKVSRSYLFALALENFIHKKSIALLDSINEAYSDESTEAEQIQRRSARKTHRRLVDGEW